MWCLRSFFDVRPQGAIGVSEHRAVIEWTAAGEFRKGRFSRVHRWRFDGGLELDASASPAIIPAPYSDAAAVDPEEAFVAAIASCHMMSFLYLANREGIEVSSYRDEAAGTLARKADGQHAITRVTLRPVVTYVESNTLSARRERELHDQAHSLCFIANSVSSEIVVESNNAQTGATP